MLGHDVVEVVWIALPPVADEVVGLLDCTAFGVVDDCDHPGKVIDYPPMGSNGRGVLLATYHATASAGSMREPFRTITLLTITDLDP